MVHIADRNTDYVLSHLMISTGFPSFFRYIPVQEEREKDREYRTTFQSCEDRMPTGWLKVAFHAESPLV